MKKKFIIILIIILSFSLTVFFFIKKKQAIDTTVSDDDLYEYVDELIKNYKTPYTIKYGDKIEYFNYVSEYMAKFIDLLNNKNINEAFELVNKDYIEQFDITSSKFKKEYDYSSFKTFIIEEFKMLEDRYVLDVLILDDVPPEYENDQLIDEVKKGFTIFPGKEKFSLIDKKIYKINNKELEIAIDTDSSIDEILENIDFQMIEEKIINGVNLLDAMVKSLENKQDDDIKEYFDDNYKILISTFGFLNYNEFLSFYNQVKTLQIEDILYVLIHGIKTYGDIDILDFKVTDFKNTIDLKIESLSIGDDIYLYWSVM